MMRQVLGFGFGLLVIGCVGWLACEQAAPPAKTAKVESTPTVGGSAPLDKHAQELLEQSKSALAAKDFDAALSTIEQIPVQSTQRAEADKLMPEVVRGFAALHLTESERFEKEGDLDEAINQCDIVLMVDEKNAAALARKETLQKKKPASPAPAAP